MSNTNPTIAPNLAPAEQALSTLNRVLATSEALFTHFVGSKFELSIAVVIDLIKLAIDLVKTIQPEYKTDRDLVETAAELAKKFSRLTRYRKQIVILITIELLRLGGTGKAKLD